MKVRKTFALSADVVRALEELSEKYNLPVSEIIELMYRELGGKAGLDELLASKYNASVMSERDERKRRQPTQSEILWGLMEREAKPVEEY